MADIPSWWGQAEIDQAYKVAQDNANKFLAGGNTQAAHNNHLIMQQLVGARDAMVAASNSGGGGGGGGGNPEADYWRQRAEEEDRQAREAASAFLTNVLKQYGMDGLAGQVSSLIQQWGSNTDVIALKLKDTQQYKDRFKGLLALQQKGITDVSNEAEYINLESSYRKVFRDAGLQSYIGDAGTANERDAIARLVGDFSLSVDEVQARVQDAQRIVADETPDEVKNALTRYYNVATSDLVAYTLDPAKAKNKINEMANTAIVGGYAGRAGLDASLSTARDIANASAGDQDLNGAALMDRFASAKDIYSSTARLAQIEKGSLSNDDALNTEFNLNDEAKKRVKGLQSRERARFGGSSGFTTGSLSTNSGT